MARARWGTAAPEDVAAARELLLDAADDCFERFGVTKTTIEDVAAAAKVSRATVYRYFDGGRDEIVLAVALRELERVAEDLIPRETPQEALSYAGLLVDGMLFTVRAARERPKVGMLYAPSKAGLPGALVGGPEALHAATAQYLDPFLAAGTRAGEFRKGLKTDEVAEWTIRVISSFVSSPSTRSRSEERRFLEEFFVPGILA